MKAIRTALAVAVIAAVAPSAYALEAPKLKPAAQFLGPLMQGSNYKVKPQARTDGIMRIFDVETPYGQFTFSGVDFTIMRLREIEAAGAIDKMSKSEGFMKALGQAAFAPIQFGANLITNPVGTIQGSMSGVGNMLDRASSSLANPGVNRDPFFESLLGVTDTQRQLAVELGVDPYSDFPPLADRLKQMASAMASGKLPVKVGLSLVPGGIGIAVSSASTIDSVKDTLRDKTAAQVVSDVRGILHSLDVSDEASSLLFKNRHYTPTDLLLMARALQRIKTSNTEIYIAHAAAADGRDEAFYQRRRAELLAARRGEIGGIDTFFQTKGQVLTLTPGNTVVAAFPFDDFAWTATPERAFTAATADLRQGDTAKFPRVFATSGAVTPTATAELQKLGWKVVKLKPVR
ncbi:MAG: hypothetical protein JO254_12225 [Pseudolabrys sp.]|nr:hypothetical protein [Pseudolabrys sp.]